MDLTQLTYSEAVSTLKAQAAQSHVALRVIQTMSEESQEDTEAGGGNGSDGVEDAREEAFNWTPLWTRWLGLPRYNFSSI